MNADITTTIDNLRKQLDDIAAVVAGNASPADERLRAVMEAHRIHTPEELEQRLSKLDWIEACRTRVAQFEEEEKPVAMQVLKLRVLKALARLDGCAQKREVRRSCHLSKLAMDSAEAALVADGVIRSTTRQTAGRPTTILELV